MARKFNENPNIRLENNEQNSNATEIMPSQNKKEKEEKVVINKTDLLPKKPKYLQLNITEYHDYISLMAER